MKTNFIYIHWNSECSIESLCMCKFYVKLLSFNIIINSFRCQYLKIARYCKNCYKITTEIFLPLFICAKYSRLVQTHSLYLDIFPFTHSILKCGFYPLPCHTLPLLTCLNGDKICMNMHNIFTWSRTTHDWQDQL